MKKVKLYKGFIPFKITEKNNSLSAESNRRAIGILLLINCILFPFNAIKNNNSIAITKEVISNNKYLSANVDINDVIKWITVYSNKIDELIIENGVGKIITRDKDLLYDLEKKGFVINEIRYEETGTVIIFTD